MKINSKEFKKITNIHNLVFDKSVNIKLIKNLNNTYWYFPQKDFKNPKNYPLLKGVNKNTKFCKFKLDLPKKVEFICEQ